MSNRFSSSDDSSPSSSEERDENSFSEEEFERTLSELKMQLQQRDYDELDPEQYTD